MAPRKLPKTSAPRRKHRLAGQSIALAVMMAAPVAVYFAAQAGATGWVSAGLGAMAASMALAMWVS